MAAELEPDALKALTTAVQTGVVEALKQLRSEDAEAEAKAAQDNPGGNSGTGTTGNAGNANAKRKLSFGGWLLGDKPS